MTGTVDFYFDFTSPYGYIASQVIEPLCAEFGVATRWHAFLVTAAYKQFESTNPLQHKPKQKYFQHDIPRTAAHFDVPFRFPPSWPENLIPPGRAFSWIEDRDPAQAKRFALAAFPAYWAAGRLIGNPDVVADIGASVGEDRAALRAALDDAGVKARYQEKVNAALAAGIFGSPQMVFGGELFWGTDRLDQLKAALRRAAKR